MAASPTDGVVGSQSRYAVRMEWGPVGAAVIGAGCDVAVVVDVLSFTTTLSVARDLGVDVLPCPWNDERADELARRHRAVRAVGRSQAGPGRVSLSPGTFRAAEPLPRLVVLPSPNGSAISAQLAGGGPQVLGAGLRNRAAVAAWITERARTASVPLRVAVLAAGERWPDGSLRPAIEDLWGAGAVISSLVELGATGLSPEAEAAAGCFAAVSTDVRDALHRCAGGIELDDRGFGDDVDVAAELDRSGATPVLADGVYSG